MNEKQILQILAAEGISLATQKLAAALAGLLIKNPALTNDQLVSTEDGSLKHYTRKKIGFFVDLFWGEIEPYLDQAIFNAIPLAREIASTSPAAE